MDFKEKQKMFQSLSGQLNSHIFIDMGLSVKWASCNVGAVRCEEFGCLFTFGSIVDFGRDRLFDKYALSQELLSLDVISGTKYDAATQIWGKGWRIPMEKEFEELVYNSDCEYHILNGIPGALFISKINKNSLFFPFAGSGYRDQSGNRESVYGLGEYWAGNGCHNSAGTWFAKTLDLHKSDTSFPIYYLGEGRNIYCAASVRAVADVNI